ncbi:MAG: hypothetical protein ACRENJ_12200 [Candidatus Eiseniibacteriota bacterium]
MARGSIITWLVVAPLLAVPAHASNCAGTQTGLVPLTALGTGTYQGYQGGLYPGGSNTRPPAHDAAGIAIAGAIAPLDTFGVADPGGRIVFISIGMSNCTQEFSTFVSATGGDAYKDPSVRAIDCAQGGQTAAIIKNPAAAYWDTVRTRLRARGSSPLQVQVAWIKEANAGPTTGFPAATTTLMRDLGSVARTLGDQFPNIRIAYLSSRIYAGYASTALNPEPYAYESGFAVKWLIEGQIAGADSLNFDPGQGPVEAPWLAWGPYLWADGVNPRPGDGLTWLCSDLANDGTHPSINGRIKVSDMLLGFVHQDETALRWYVTSPVAAPPPVAPGIRLALAPNPARGTVEMRFTPTAGEPWRLEVLDTSGRRMRGLGSGTGDGALHARRWDGRDERGAPAGAGVYWARLVNGSRTEARRVVLLSTP